MGIAEYQRASAEYLELLGSLEMFWKQRDKVHWLQYGDLNSKFFHSYASGSIKRNNIEKLRDCKRGVERLE